MDTPIIDTLSTPAAAPPHSARLPLRQGRQLLFILILEAAGLYFSGGILGILLGFAVSIFLPHAHRLGH
ncbi:MAG: hypothetical protein J0H49_21810 [Acidobacteria bacterium]|nr:hypothetical protein [Acidobacteriota bacterium]